MQLPPTVLSLDNEKKKKKKAVPTPPTSKSVKKDVKPKGSKATKEPPLVDDNDSDANSSASNESDEQIANAVASVSLNHKGSFKLVPPKSLETTLFDRLEAMYGSGIKRMLEIQYR